MYYQKAKLFISALALAFATVTATAQTYRLPGQHAKQQGDLLANQEKLEDQFNLSINHYIEFAEEEEPEDDIYTEGWNSGFVNCYKGVDVPQTAVIDVRNYCMPVKGYMTSPYGWRKRFGRMHRGVDLTLRVGDTVRAAFNGRVRITKYEAKGYGYYVVLRHNNQLETVYGHLSKFLVKPDQYVKAGDPIALGGNTGRSTGPHLHFETRYMGYAINPSAIFDFANQCTHTDTYTFDKRTYEQPRNFSPEANAQYAQRYNQSRANEAYSNTGKSKGTSKSTSKKASSTSKSYTVKKGDSLSKIAARNGISMSRLCQLNGIKSSSKINPGQKLRIK